jgi:hypothetical protein
MFWQYLFALINRSPRILASRPLPSQLSFRYSYKDCFF